MGLFAAGTKRGEQAGGNDQGRAGEGPNARHFSKEIVPKDHRPNKCSVLHDAEASGVPARISPGEAEMAARSEQPDKQTKHPVRWSDRLPVP